MKEGLKPQKHPQSLQVCDTTLATVREPCVSSLLNRERCTWLWPLWNPGRSCGIVKLFAIPFAMWFNAGLKTGEERRQEMCFFLKGLPCVFSLLPIRMCGDFLLMDDLSAYRKWLFSGEAGGDGGYQVGYFCLWIPKPSWIDPHTLLLH